MKPLYLKFVDKGIANRFEFEDCEVIEMNEKIKLYPELFYHVLMHEVEHEEGKYKPRDFIHDINSRTPGLFKFMRNHISAWTQVLPIYWDKGKRKFIYDISAIASWLMIGALAIGTSLLLRWLI